MADPPQIQQMSSFRDTLGLDSLLIEAGLSTFSGQHRQLFQKIYINELELCVGMVLSRNLTGEELTEFEEIDAGDDEAAVAWLAQHIPNYKGTVTEVNAKLRKEIREQPPTLWPLWPMRPGHYRLILEVAISPPVLASRYNGLR